MGIAPAFTGSPFSFGRYISRIKETMTLEDPETTIERLYHEMYGALSRDSFGSGVPTHASTD